MGLDKALERLGERLLDRDWRLRNLYRITDKAGRRVLFEPNWAQVEVFDSLARRNVDLKVRQLGLTTGYCILWLDACLFNRDLRVGIVAHTKDDARVIFRDKIKLAYEALPDEVRTAIPAVKCDAHELLLANGSGIRVGVTFRSGTVQVLHVTEYGYVCQRNPQRAEEIRTGAFQAVPADGIIVVESTAKGRSGHFHALCQEAQKGGGWRFTFLPWHRHPEYTAEVEQPLEYKAEGDYLDRLEAQIGRTLTPQQRQWWCLKHRELGDDIFAEYPSTPEEAFKASTEGAYYGSQMLKAWQEDRVTAVPVDKALLVDEGREGQARVLGTDEAEDHDPGHAVPAGFRRAVGALRRAGGDAEAAGSLGAVAVMSLASLFPLPLQDPASAGSFVSGPSQQQAASQPPIRGLAPPDAEANPPPIKATGLTETLSGEQGPPNRNETSPAIASNNDGLSYTQGVVKALGGDPYHFQFSDGLSARGLIEPHWMRVGGSYEPMNEPRTFELSSNARWASAFEFLANAGPEMDWTGTLGTVRDINDLGAYLDRRGSESAANRFKQAIEGMGFQAPTPEQLGVIQEYVPNESGEMAPAYNSKDLVERYRSALRMAALERQGTIELDHDNWTIKTIGAARLTPDQFVQEIRDRYRRSFADGVTDANTKLAAGQRPIGASVPLDIQRGVLADRWAKKAILKYLDSIGVPEGPSQLIALGRRAYFQDQSGLHAYPDLLIDAGISRRHILDGKATTFEDLPSGMTSQLSRYHDLGVDSVEATTPNGHVPIPRRIRGLKR